MYEQQFDPDKLNTKDLHRRHGSPLIIAEGVSKKFCRDTRRSQWYGLADSYGFTRDKCKLRKGEFWSVKDVSLQIRRGECLGLLGHNGAGKSTLLKLLTGLLRPDAGIVSMKGRVSAMIELGTGFNPILTGRENIYNNGATLGIGKKEIDRKLDAIIDFSGLADLIDTPIQYYSSGMKVRLGFAVATQMESDILLIDEVLSVGDMNFVLKCFNRMDELLPQTAVILVSHSIPNITRAASSIGVMHGGRLIHYGNDVPEGISRYNDLLQLPISPFEAGHEAKLTSIKLTGHQQDDESKENIPELRHGEPFCLEISILANTSLQSCDCYLVFQDATLRNIAEVLNGRDHTFQINVNQGETIKFKATFEYNPFSQGMFSVAVGFYARINGTRKMIFRIPIACHFKVNSDRFGWASVNLDPVWTTAKEINITG